MFKTSVEYREDVLVVQKKTACFMHDEDNLPFLLVCSQEVHIRKRDIEKKHSKR